MMTETQSKLAYEYARVGYRIVDYTGGPVVLALKKYGRVSTVTIMSDGSHTMESRPKYNWE